MTIAQACWLLGPVPFAITAYAAWKGIKSLTDTIISIGRD
jgi:hypothetical protein